MNNEDQLKLWMSTGMAHGLLKFMEHNKVPETPEAGKIVGSWLEIYGITLLEENEVLAKSNLTAELNQALDEIIHVVFPMMDLLNHVGDLAERDELEKVCFHAVAGGAATATMAFLEQPENKSAALALVDRVKAGEFDKWAPRKTEEKEGN